MTDGAEEASAPGRPRRLKKRPDFLAVTGGKRFHTERLTAQARLRQPDEVREGAPAEGLHIGFTITKRVGHATERNRIRRRLRRAVELAAADAASPRADVVVVGRRPALSAPFATLVDDLRRALRVVTKPHASKTGGRGAATTGEPSRERAHVPRRRGSGRPSHTPDTASTDAAHGSTDG